MRHINTYPFYMFRGQNSEDEKILQFELVVHIEQVSDHVWSEQVANFPKWEKNAFGEYESQTEPIPIPVVCYMRFHNGRAIAENNIPDRRDLVASYMKPLNLTMTDTYSELKLFGHT